MFRRQLSALLFFFFFFFSPSSLSLFLFIYTISPGAFAVMLFLGSQPCHCFTAWMGRAGKGMMGERVLLLLICCDDWPKSWRLPKTETVKVQLPTNSTAAFFWSKVCQGLDDLLLALNQKQKGNTKTQPNQNRHSLKNLLELLQWHTQIFPKPLIFCSLSFLFLFRTPQQ